MPVTVIPSSQQQSTRKKSSTSRKRRQNQNEEIHELASLVPFSSSQAGSLVASNGGKPQTISVLRLTTTFLKLQSFMKDASPLSSSDCEDVSKSGLSLGRMEEAIDGFLIVLDKDANILYVSETIAGHVGLIQQDVIGQNLADITHPEFVADIKDSLKPSVILPTSMSEDVTISQYRQFFLRMVPIVSYSTSPSHSIVLVRGNLKVKLSPSNITTKGSLEFVEPSVIGFIGECRVVESVASIVEVSIPHSSFIITRSLDMQKVISVEAMMKDVVGYDPEVMLSPDLNIGDFFHPSDHNIVTNMRKFLVQNGHVVSPRFRFLTSSGEWVWLQMEGKLRSNFWEIKIRALGQWGGRLKYIQQRELYSSELDYQDNAAIPKLTSTSSKYRTEDGAKPIIDSLKSTRMPESVLEPVIHGRSVAVDGFSDLLKQMLSKKENDTTSMQCDQALPTANSESSSSSVDQSSTIGHSGSLTQSDIDTPASHLPSSQISNLLQANIHFPDTHDQSPMRLGSTTPPLISNSGSVDTSMLATESASQSHITQQLLQESCKPILRIPNPVEQNACIVSESPLTSVSSVDSFPASTMLVTPHQQEFIPNSEQFLNFTNPVEVCSLYNYATSADFSPPNSYPVDMDTGTVLQTAASTDSIPSAAAPVPFPNSQSQNFIPQAPLSTDFDPHIPTDFNFLDNTAHNFQTFGTAQSLDVSMLAAQQFDSSSPLLVNTSGALMQHLVDEIGKDSDLNSAFSVPDCNMTTNSCSNLQANLVLNSNSLPSPGSYAATCTPAQFNAIDQDHSGADFLCDSQMHMESSSNSNPEVQDILQQFI